MQLEKTKLEINRFIEDNKSALQLEIMLLTEDANIAKSEGIIENNFNVFNSNESGSDLAISIGENNDLPKWYLYGEKILLEKIKQLENRNSNSNFASRKLYELSNNKKIIEKLLLNSDVDRDAQSFTLELSSFPPQDIIPLNKKRLVLLAFIGGLLISIFLIMIFESLNWNSRNSKKH